MPQCQYCSESFGNEGAKSSHEAHCDQNPANQSGGEPAPQSAEQSQPPARQDSGGGGRQGDARAPATQDNGSDPVSLGMELGESLASLRSGDPEEQAAAEGRAVKVAGAALAQFGEQYAKEKISEVREAKSRADDDIQVAEEYPTCPRCGDTIEQVPPDQQEFPCPGCGVQLEFSA